MNKKILREIKKLSPRTNKNLPKMFFFTDRKRVDDIFAVIGKLPKNTAVIIREYDLNENDRFDFAKKVAVILKQKKLKILVGKSWNLAKEIDADGVHFSDLDKSFFIPKNRGNMVLSYSCHSLKSLAKAKKFNADLVFYSPIFKSESHPNQKPIGTFALRNFVKQSAFPVFALGGIDEKNISLLKRSGIVGIGGISMF